MSEVRQEDDFGSPPHVQPDGQDDHHDQEKRADWIGDQRLGEIGVHHRLGPIARGCVKKQPEDQDAYHDGVRERPRRQYTVQLYLVSKP